MSKIKIERFFKDFDPQIDVNDFYTNSFAKHGQSPKALHWNSKERQELRFDVLLSFVDDIANASVCDVGCGFGDLYLFANPKPLKYTGIEFNKEFAKIAQRQTNQKILNIDISIYEFELFDYYLISGTLNVMPKEKSNEIIKKCFEASNKAFIFNCLEYSQIENHKIYNGYTIKELHDLASKLNGKIKIKSGYIAGDLTIVLYR